MMHIASMLYEDNYWQSMLGFEQEKVILVHLNRLGA